MKSSYPSDIELVEQACREAGSEEFGPGDFRDGLQVLLASLERDADLPAEGVTKALEIVRRRLHNRLRIEQWYAAHPELARETIVGPIAVTGLVRTGTTALGNMLSLDARLRSLRMWEQDHPCPPPEMANEASDPRRLEAMAQVAAMPAELMAMHLFEVDATTEDTEVLGLSFRAQQMTLPAYGYHAWWRDCDMRPAYAYHRRVAVLLQSRRPPNRWLFKSPHLKFHLEHFLDAYPDARFVMTHRDPAKVVPSYANLVAHLVPPGSTAARDPQRFGRHISEHLRIGMERAMAARARIGEHRFIDVHHREFIRDPYGQIERIYGFLGMEFPAQVRDAMQQWQARNHAGAYGAHRYSAAQYGLSTEQIRSDYGFYIRQFDVSLEG
ncbi:MAG: sulfotransferase [Gammaproteobacteria bacterium]